MGSIRPPELESRLEADNEPFVLDIRPRRSYRSGSIAPSHNVPVYNDLRRGNDDALCDRMDELPRDREIIVVCKQGIVAKRARGLLTEAGYDAVTLAGGMGGWNGYRNGTLGYRVRAFVWRLFG